ncbi:tetratricopeptide repeat protein [Rhizosaccharibacter radicis]|uniref:Tetratricopeptide repeat protein n=1 Tax=Rhizosaccharibacter radicis TaxID=2782605 RepID=A0ABT1W0P6_9PROT|nr:tetratricopeptide repeat protein [Acetobacteraceae bacterium KSS12]
MKQPVEHLSEPDLARPGAGRKRPARGIDEAIAHATEAQERADWPEALARWREAAVDHPGVPVFHASELAILQVQGRFDDAARKAEEAAILFPDRIEIIAQRITIAIRQERWLLAAGLLARLRENHGDHRFLRDNGQALGATIRRGLSSASLEALVREGLAADAAGDAETAVLVWGAFHTAHRGDRNALLGYGRALRGAGRLDAADRLLSDAVRAFPADAELAAHHAEVAADRQDWKSAALRWQAILSAFPDVHAFVSMAAASLMEAGDYDRARTLLREALVREPERLELHVRLAVLAERQENWEDAVQCWDVAHRLRPDDANIRNSRGDAIWQRNAERLGTASGDADAPSAATDAMPVGKELALLFEGLGDHCEFGIVQRRLGAEPIGLFRFAAISAGTLTRLLDEDLVALGDPAFLELGLTDHNEYMLKDTRGLYHMHCFVQRGRVDEHKFLKQQTTRLGYLKRKLLEDLEAGNKIFVHKSSHERITDEAAIALHDAVERFGPNTLLVIRKADDDNAAGSVSVIRDRLLVGHVGTPYNDKSAAIDQEAWEMILPAAAARFRARATERRPAA